jgi:hypothetical protein
LPFTKKKSLWPDGLIEVCLPFVLLKPLIREGETESEEKSRKKEVQKNPF